MLTVSQQNARKWVPITLLVIGMLHLGQLADAAETEISPEKLSAIKELLTITGVMGNSQQFSRAFSQQLVSLIKFNNPDIPQKAIDIIHEEVNKMVVEEFSNETLQNQIYPIYASHFTLEELQGLVAFNKSPVGIKANQVMPLLMQESMTAAKSWSESVAPKIFPRVLKRLHQEGIEVKVQKQP